MKKITFFYLLVLSSLFLNAQDLSWSPYIKTNNYNEVVECIGSEDKNNYFISSTSQDNLFYKKMKIYLFKTNASNEFVLNSLNYDFGDAEIIKTKIKNNRINVFIKEYKSKTYTVDLYVFDLKSLNKIDNESKRLFEIDVDRGDKLILYYSESKDGNKYSLNYLALDRKTEKGYLYMNVFEYDNTPFWTNRFESDFEGSLSVYDFHLKNNGELSLYTSNEIPINKKKSNYNIAIITTDEYGKRNTEFSIPVEYKISSLKYYILDNNIVFLASKSEDDEYINTYKLDLEQRDIISSNRFKIHNRENEEYTWTISKLHQLDNGNLVIPIENKFTFLYIQNNVTSYSYTNSNLSFIIIDPVDNQVVYKTFIPRAMNFYTNRKLKHGYFETPYYFIDGNDFYAIYNNIKKFEDLNGNGAYSTPRIKTKGSSKIETIVLKIDETGTPKIEKLFTKKKDKKIFSAYTSFFNKDNELIISEGNTKGFSFARYNYK